VELNPRDGHLDRTPLLFAAERRHKEVADLLVARGAEMDLHIAAALGDEAKVTVFLDKDPAAVNAKGPEGGTPLHFAGTPGMAKLLLDRGADINARDEHRHNSVLGWSLKRPEVARIIVDRLGNLDIFIACALGDTDRIREFLAKDQALANARTPKDHPVGGGRAPISIAAMRGQIEAVRALLDAGADANALDRRGATPLHHAAGEGMADMVQLLLDRGANPNYREENWNSTPLDWAAYGENPAVVEMLKKVTRPK
jgi:ankyrin repeat protein